MNTDALGSRKLSWRGGAILGRLRRLQAWILPPMNMDAHGSRKLSWRGGAILGRLRRVAGLEFTTDEHGCTRIPKLS